MDNSQSNIKNVENINKVNNTLTKVPSIDTVSLSKEICLHYEQLNSMIIFNYLDE